MPQLTMLKICLKMKEGILLEALEELLPQVGVCLMENERECDGLLYAEAHSKGDLPSLDYSKLSQPLRFLDFLSLLENLPYGQEITFFHFSLDLREKLLKNLKTLEVLRLTEKECQLLRFFYQHKGQEQSKDKLLQEIWDYHPEAETHTLETHIYRLRQKLEEDPNAPQILLNGKEGYWMT